MVSFKIVSRNLERSVKFYKDALGYDNQMPEQNGVKVRLDENNYLKLEDVGAKEILRSTEIPREISEALDKGRLGAGVIIGLHVPDADETYAKIESMGGKIVRKLISSPDEIGFVCKDPDGYVLAIHSHPHGH